MRCVVLLIFSLCFVSARAVDLGLGSVYRDTDVAVDLSYTNQSAAVVMIGKVDTSCDCLKLLAVPGKVNPGEKVVIPFNYRSAVTGRVSIAVQVLGAESGQVLTTYAINGFVCEKPWLVSASELKGDESVVYIDTRRKEQFAEVHIPRSINLPAFVLKARSDLKEQRVVLVDAGFAPDELLEIAGQLRSQGFSRVSVLSGGMAAWLRAGGAYEGTAAEPRLTVASISASDYARARRSGSWRQVELSATAQGGVNAKADSAHLYKAIGTTHTLGRVQNNILVVAPALATYARLETEIRPEHAGVFYLSGGAVALETYRTQQSSLAENTDRRFEVRQTQGHPIIAGGSKSCGTCGSR